MIVSLLACGHHVISVPILRLFREELRLFARKKNAPACKTVATLMQDHIMSNRLISQYKRHLLLKQQVQLFP